MNVGASRPPAEITVVMGTHNGSRYVREQLQTILQQTLPPAEIVVADDCSTDDTVAVVARVAAHAQIPIRIHRNDSRLGFAENFLAACDLASSRLIAFSDQDDHWYPHKLAASREALVRNGAVLCVHGVDDIDASGGFLRPNPQRITRERVYEPLEPNPWDVYYGFTMLFERSLLDKLDRSARGDDIYTPGKSLSHDRWIFFLATCFGRVVTLPESLAGYRQHGSQLFGGPVARSIPRRILDKLALGGSELGYLAAIAAQRAEILGSLGADDRLAARAARQWRRFGAVLSASAELRSASGPVPKVSLVVDNVRRGAYRAMGRGGLGYQFLVEDLATMIAAPFVRRRPVAAVSVPPAASVDR